ncbi:MAG: hypothetical protein HFE75_12545 [Firmicutes bacterium]|jgi:hypothetical protein|nr:hypothetical protein [Bacillota bacterium]
MEMAVVVKTGIIVFGIVMIAAGFWFHSIRKLAVNFAVCWAWLGALLALAGAILPTWVLSRMFGAWQGIPFLCLVGILSIGGFLGSMILSQLMMKNRELAMRVALLIEEREQMELELEEDSKQHEKTAVGY